jgi:amidohydrolase
MGDTDKLLIELLELRHRLHRRPELAEQEIGTAGIVRDFLQDCHPDKIVENLGGHGLAAIFRSPEKRPGPVVMLRAELDALPLDDASDCPWPSEISGCAHKCGHDGHMAILAGVARRLQQCPPASGSVILLFQPAEETGVGAAKLLADPRFVALKPDWLFALHNLPGHPDWSILTREGAFAAGSLGVKIGLHGATSHAAYPELGNSPDQAMAELVMGLVNLSSGEKSGLALVTVVHARLGEEAFGISPGEAEILATIRADQSAVLQRLKGQAAELGRFMADKHGLECAVEYCEEFPVTVNDPAAVEVIRQVADELDLEMESPEESPFRWSEDFGFLTAWTKGAMFGLGAGVDHPVLHGPEYDFNDDLLLPGVTVLERICRTVSAKTA